MQLPARNIRLNPASNRSLVMHLNADHADLTPPPPGGGESSRPPYRSPKLLWIITLVALAAVVFFQRPQEPDLANQSKLARGEIILPPGSDPTVIASKLVLGMKTLAPGQEQVLQSLIDGMVGWTGADDARPASISNPPVRRKHPFPAADRLRAAMLAGELLPAEEVAWRLDDVERDLAPDSPLHLDIHTLRALQGIGPKPAPDIDAERPGDSTSAVSQVAKVAPVELSAEAKAGLRERHTLFAELAFSRDDANNPARARATTDGQLLFAVIFVAFVVVGAVFFAGFVLLILAIANASKLRPRFVRPNPETEFPADESCTRAPGSAWLETFCVFVLAFLGVKGVSYLLVTHTTISGTGLLAISFALQAATVATIFWPIARGMTFDRWKREIGFVAPRGVFREIGAGIAAYIAAVPLYIGLAIVVVTITLIWERLKQQLFQMEPALPESNRITEILGEGGLLGFFILLLMATIWAPLVEESIFRGAVYRHLRRRLGLLASAAISALVFAGLHGYIIQGVLMVASLGFFFAIMREWRGSIIPGITAHFIHNAFVTCLLGVFMSLASP